MTRTAAEALRNRFEEERLGKWLQWKSVERALGDAAPFLEGAPSSRDTAAGVLGRLFAGGGDG